MNEGKRKQITDMTNLEAKEFLLKNESYVSTNLPGYFNFTSVIDRARTKLKGKDLKDLAKTKKSLSNTEKVNYMLLVNKGSNYAWRPLQILHPIVYVDLVNTITEKDNWLKICNRIQEFRQDPKIQCVSMPGESLTRKSDTAESILNWWENLEQAQIELALDFEYCISTDITDCYSSIYTHTIPWAIHTKSWAKCHRREGIGNEIDSKITYLQHGQTNGIPQGSILMDFIAEIILGYVDLLLSEELNKLIEQFQLSDFKIIRYRDDYRIFSNYKEQAELIIKLLSKILHDLNMNLNPSKTFLSSDVIQDAIKPDKIYWDMQYLTIHSINKSKKEFKIGIQKHIFQIKILSDKYPNSGSIKKALADIYKFRIYELKRKPKDIHQIISIVTYIMKNNSNSVEYCTTILSKLFYFLTDSEVNEVIDKILLKFKMLPNTDYIEVWLQRLSILDDKNKNFGAKLCKKISEKNNTNIWDSSWLKESDFDESDIIDEEYLVSMHGEIPISEMDLFSPKY